MMRVGRWAPVTVEIAVFRTLTLPLFSKLSNVFSMVRLSTLMPSKPLVGSPAEASVSKRATCAFRNSLEPGWTIPPDSFNILKNSFSRRSNDTLLLECGVTTFSFCLGDTEATQTLSMLSQTRQPEISYLIQQRFVQLRRVCQYLAQTTRHFPRGKDR